MIDIPTFSVNRPKRPFQSETNSVLDKQSDLYQKFLEKMQKLKTIGDDKLGKFKWEEGDDIPEEGNLSCFHYVLFIKPYNSFL